MIVRKLSVIFMLSFASNWIWENIHSVLYFHPNGELMTQTMLLRATLFDAVFISIMSLAFLLIPFLRQRLWYSIIFGVVTAIVIELQALDAGRWAYTDSMPIVPIINTGLTPTIQLGLLAYIIFKLLKLNKSWIKQH